MTRRPSTPIGAHGVIGDLETIALIGHGATVEWMCWPRFDSPSIFGCLLDREGGFWSIWPSEVDFEQRQLYLPETNVMVTRFQLESGMVEVEDFLNVAGDERALVRRVCSLRGDVEMSSLMVVRPDYGRGEVALSSNNGQVEVDLGSETLHAAEDVDLAIEDDAVKASFTIHEGEAAVFTFGRHLRLLGQRRRRWPASDLRRQWTHDAGAVRDRRRAPHDPTRDRRCFQCRRRHLRCVRPIPTG